MGEIKLNPYLFFSGDCKEAMDFYKSIFGGEITAQTYEESTGAPDQENMKDKIMHSSLDGEVSLMGSDSTGASAKAAKVELSLSGEDEEKLRKYWDGLSEGGKIRMPLEKAPWGDHFGMLTDKYNIDWMVNITAPKA